MKALQGFTVWTVVVFCCLFEISQGSTCKNCDSSLGLSVTTTSIKTPEENCNLTVNEKSYQSHVPNLDPGGVYTVYSQCFNCCLIATEPEKVSILTIESTTSSLSLNWEKPNGTVSNYYVEWTGGSTNGNKMTSNTAEEISGLASGGQYSVTVTAVAGDGHTKGKGFTKSIYTKPEQIRNLTVTKVTTSSMTLNWTKPEGHSSFYIVQWTSRDGSKTDNVTEPFPVITGLTAGMEYNITVTAVAGDHETKGDGVSEVQYTKPQQIRNLTVTEVTTSSMTLNWTKPEGHSSFYIVQWASRDGSKTANVTEPFPVITGLTAGMEYNITVTAVAGDHETKGDGVSEVQYTKPEQIRNLTVTEVTTSSMTLNWTRPEGHSSFYIVQWTSSDGSKTTNVTEPFTVISGLTAGMEYNITVTAVAGDNWTIGGDTKQRVYTKPEQIRNLTVTEVTTSSMTLNWTKPEGHSSFYIVQWTSRDGSKTDNVTEPFPVITGLTAGMEYNITVTAVAGDHETKGDGVSEVQYTKPEQIRNLTVTEVTTSSMTLNWTKPEGHSSFYIVQWTSRDGSKTDNVTEPFPVITGLTAGMEYNITVTAVAGDHETKGDGVSEVQYTKPEQIRNLTVTEVTTSSMTLNWTKPEGHSSFYIVQWASSDGSKTANVTEPFPVITGLTAGMEYNITVTAVAGDHETKGDGVSEVQYTRPMMPADVTVNYRDTSSLNISWTLPAGRVDHYEVQLNRIKKQTDKTMAHFSGLLPGQLYTVNIMAVAGSFSNSSESEFATYPMPPQSVNITGRTVSSLDLSWDVDPKMQDAPNINYSISYEGVNLTSTVRNVTLPQLQSGYYYDITVKTVGPQNLHSTGLNISACTNPNPVLHLQAFPESTTSLKVEWSYPSDHKQNYSYSIFIYNATRNLIRNESLQGNSTSLPELEPGTKYIIAVTTRLTEECQSTKEEVSKYTNPNPVLHLQAFPESTTSLKVEWSYPSDHKQIYSYSIFIYNATRNLIRNESLQGNSTSLPELEPGTKYIIAVTTRLTEECQSTKEEVSKYTKPAAVTITEISGSTSNLTVSWDKAEGGVDNYTVILSNITGPAQTMGPLSNSISSTTFTGLKPGVLYCATVVTNSGPLQTNSNKSCNATFPNPPRNIVVKSQTERSILFSWDDPEEMQPDQKFKVTTSNGDDTETENKAYELKDLEPGRSYSISVATVGVNDYMSEMVSKEASTKPAAVNIAEISGSTTNLTVSWDKAEGGVDKYTVILSNITGPVETMGPLSNSTSSTTFTGLKPGVLYCTIVVTNSGPLQTNSNKSCNATLPNPPRNLHVSLQTVQSLNFTWNRPEDMQPDQYTFIVVINDSPKTQNSTEITEQKLESGSPYTITVVTVGVNSLQSQKVTTTAYTRPYPVTDLQQTEITPDSVTLWWNQTDYRPNYTHVVEVSDISGLISPPDNVTDLTYKARGLNSGTNYSFTVTTLTADGTAASAETVSYFTRPYGITNLVADTLNTTCISLTWTHPLEYKPEYRYVVQTSGCSKTFDKPAISNNTEFTGLNPGTNCSFCVTVIAENGIESVASCTSAYTMPEKVVPHISSQGLNNSMLFSWTKPRGNVDFYRVYLHGTTWTYVELEPTVQSYVFRNLSAGRNYTAVVETHSGNFSAPSESVTNATFPNPPGVIDVLNKTTNSIHVGWAEAPQMAGAQFYYQVEISTNKVDSTTQTNYAFGELESGTSYNVTVTTVAAMGFKSETVRHYMITTTPFPVKNLQAEPTVESVVLTWENPDQYKDSYRFKVLDSNGKSETTKLLSHTMLGLDAGSSYWFTVTTETSDGTTGKTVNITKCTNASPVTSINCKAPNKPNATITWTWERAQGRFSSFLVQFEKEAPGTVESCCNFVKGDLKHYSNYTVNVTTQSCGRPSAPVSRTCQTGITDPPVPTNYKSMLQHDVTCHQFSIILSRSLLNNINGPVQHVGVLVTETAPGSLGVDKPDMGVYLESTYDTWKKKKTNAYLATVINVKDVNVKTRNTEPLIIHVGDETTWYSYGNGILEPTKEYNYAIVLFTSLAMNDQGIISPLSSLFSYTQFDNTVKLPQDPVIIGMAVGVTLGIFSVLLIVLIGFIIYWRRLSKKESSDIQIHSLRNFPVKVEDYELYYKKQKADSNCGFAGEYEDLKVVGTAQSKTNALTPENKPKNRYNNVLPYDASRVKLSIIHGNPLDDYINANYIPGYNSKKEFIAAQGPLPATVNDFWRMIWEKNVHTVVMLTRCNEQGRVKCEQYWMPGTKHYGNITVTTTSEISLEDWTIRDFDVKNVKTAETRSVRHFHFTAWPDHGVPETTELLISFRHLVREHMDQYRHSPTVVHCSAGVGRTGTFIAIDRLIFQIERENVVDVYGIVHDMRMHRGLMVQTEDQYVFLNQCALDVIRSRTGNNVDLIYQNMAAFAIYENVESIELQQRNEK